MDVLLAKVAAALILPPGGNIVAGILGLALLRRARFVAVLLLALSVGSLLVLSIPIVGDALMSSVETYSPRPPGAVVADEVGAIVVLGGGRNKNAAEYGGETVSYKTLERLRYAARLHRETGLPILASGGRVFNEPASEAALMQDVLVDELGVGVRWLEERSRNTAENARFTAEVLGTEGVTAVILVTHALHMPRASEAFEEAGIRVYAAPTGYITGTGGRGVFDWLPSMDGLGKSTTALHEHLGTLWYRIRY